MSGMDKPRGPSRKPAPLLVDADQRLKSGGPRHMKAVSGPGMGHELWATQRLISVAARLIERRLNRRLARLKLTTAALDAMEAVAKQEPATAADVASMLCVSRQSLGKVLQRLKALGYLSKERGRDGRSADLRLTPAGRAALAAAEKLIGQESSEGTGTDFADEVLFRQQLEQRIRHLRSAEPGSNRASYEGKEGTNRSILPSRARTAHGT